MHNRRRGLDAGLVLALLLTLFAGIPLLSNPGLPNGPDVLYHSYRAAEMQRSWANGLLFPRWAEGLYLGYGSPLFHFYASLSYALTSLLQSLLGLGVLDSLRTLLMGSLLFCSGGMYLFMRRRSGRLGAVLAGLLYVYSPYLVYTEPYARGTYPELLAFAIFPLLLWRVDALRDHSTPGNFILLVLLQAALVNAHNLMALTLSAIALAWIGFETLVQRWNREAGRLDWRPGALAVLALLLGMAASATFWLPVLLESDTVHLQNLTVAGLLDYRHNFVPLGDLLSPPPIHDAGAINGLSELKIVGIAQWTLALAGGATAGGLYLRGCRTRHPQAFLGGLFFALLALLLTALTVPRALGLWDALRPLQFLQFPWRLLGPLAACLAILGGLNGLWLERLRPRAQISLTALLIALPIVAAIPLFFVPEWRLTALDTSIAAYHEEEKARRQLGTTFTDEFRPRDVHNLPDPTEVLLADYADGYPIDKLNRAHLPPAAEAVLLHNSPQAHEWRIRSTEGFTAEIFNFYWLGWRAEIDGAVQEIAPSPHHGLITVSIPPGEHRLRVYLAATPARELAAWVSLAALLLTGLSALLLRRRFRPRPYARAARLSSSARNGILLGGGLALLCIALFFREGIAWLDSPPGSAPAQVQQKFTLDDRLQVLGYDLNAAVLRPGERLRLRVYWYALEEIELDFSSFLHLSTGGPPAAQIDKLHPAGRAISEWWSPAGYIADSYDLLLPPQLPPGEYHLTLGLYTCALMPAGECGNGYRPQVRDAAGELIGDSVPLAVVRVVD